MSNSFVDQLLQGGSTTGDLEKIAGPEALAVLNELEKTASDEGIDLGQFSDEQIVELIQEAMMGEYEGVEKVASAPGHEDYDAPHGVDMEKIAAADYLGRVQAHAMADELAGLWGFEKTAGVEDLDEDEFEQLATMNANDVLHAIGALDGGDADAVDGREKVASINFDEQLSELIGQRTAELLDGAGWDVDAIAGALNGE